MRLDRMQAVYEAGSGLVGEHVRLTLVGLAFAEANRDWSEPVRLRVVDSETHPGFVDVEFQKVEE